MNIETQQIIDWIQQGLPDANIQVMTEDGHHFQAIVISESFIGKSMLEQHRMVYDALGTKMGNEIHALALSTKTPAEVANANS